MPSVEIHRGGEGGGWGERGGDRSSWVMAHRVSPGPSEADQLFGRLIGGLCTWLSDPRRFLSSIETPWPISFAHRLPTQRLWLAP